MSDLRHFAHYILRQWDVGPRKVEREMIERYLGLLYERGSRKTSQARSLSGIRSFFNFLLLEEKSRPRRRNSSRHPNSAANCRTY